MDKQLRLLIATIILFALSSFAQIVRQDDFQRADGAMGSNWSYSLNGSMLTLVDGAATEASGNHDCIWTADAFSLDQFSETVIREYYIGAAEWVGVWVRRKTTGEGYIALAINGNINLYDGSFSMLASTPATVTGGDKIKLVATGTNPVRLRTYLNGTLINDYNDSVYLYVGGSPGAAIYTSATASSIESWAGGEGDGAGVIHPIPPTPWRLSPGGMRCRNKRVISGVTFMDFTSNYNYYSGITTTLRYLAPSSPASGMPHRFIYILPVEDTVPGVLFGDGLNEIVSSGLQNTYNITLIAPVFTHNGTWGADHTSDLSRRDESFLLQDIIPWTQANLALTGTEQNWIIGFSRSGYAVVDLLMRNPTIFNAGAAWDFPADFVWSDFASYDYPYGTQANFDTNYKLQASFLTTYASPFQSKTRLWLSGDAAAWQSQVLDFKARLDMAGVKYLYSNAGTLTHSWSSGWVPRAVAGLQQIYDLSISTGVPSPLLW